MKHQDGAISRRDVLALAMGGLIGGALPGPLTSAASRAGVAGRPNVLFIAVDDLRPQLGCYGHDAMHSPYIDRLASEGTVFLRTYCQQAVSAPSRASLLTGLRPDSTGIHDLNTPVREELPDVLTLPRHFRNHGYNTVSLGKIYHHHSDDPAGWSADPWRPKGAWPGYALEGNERLRRRLWEEGGRKKPFWKVLGPPVEAGSLPDGAYPDGRLTERAITELRALRGEPFFLAVGYVKPHLAFACPRKYWDIYDADAVDLADNPFRPAGCPDIALHNWGELRAYHGVPAEGPLSDERARELVRGYYACVSFIDAQVGRLLKELERLDLADGTVVCLWGDHGWNLGEHGLWCKHCNFETSVHSPLIVRAPGTPSGVRTRALTEFVDIYPSLCELCDLPVPGHLEGTSFLPLLTRPERPWKPAAFSQYPRGRAMGYTMRTDRYRYTEWRGADGSVLARELYDHETDPAENVNLATAGEASTMKRLGNQLEAGWRAAFPET